VPISECPATTFKCINCIKRVERDKIDLNVNHAVWDVACPSYKIAVEKFKNDILLKQQQSISPSPITTDHDSNCPSNDIIISNFLVMYTNISSLMAEVPSFQAYLQNTSPACVLLTETWLSSPINNSILGINNYLLFRDDRQSRGDGVAILLKKSILHSYNINKLNIKVPHIESLFLQLREGNTTVTLGCVYRPPDTSQEDDIKLIDQLRNLSMVHGELVILIFQRFTGQ
jgi:hypothetical protein